MRRLPFCHPNEPTCLWQVKREMTPAAKALGAPFKPYFGLSGLGCLPDLFVIRSELRISYYALHQTKRLS